MKKILLLSVAILLFSTCSDDEIPTNTYPDNYYTNNYGNPQIKNKIYEKDGRTYLWGGEDSTTHFDISNFSLNTDFLHFGLGREKFEALISPQYMSVEDVGTGVTDDTDCIVLRGENNLIKVYPYSTMLEYEAINEEIDGEPVMIAYCVLADLAAVYTRRYCNEVLTFGLSGYTYADPFIWDGIDGFVLWDRETESLWWPLVDKAVSGSMLGVVMEKYLESNWNYDTWAGVKANYPDALVLKPSQKVTEDVLNWPMIAFEDLNCN